MQGPRGALGQFGRQFRFKALAAIGQHTLHGDEAPVRHKASRRRIKTVMQEMIYKAGRMIHHAGRWVLGLGANDPGFAAFQRHYAGVGSG